MIKRVSILKRRSGSLCRCLSSLLPFCWKTALREFETVNGLNQESQSFVLTLMATSTQVVEVNVTNISPSPNYSHRSGFSVTVYHHLKLYKSNALSGLLY